MSNPTSFIAAVSPAAVESFKTTGIWPSFVIAEAALESAWGNSRLAQEGYNLFGVKADSAWHGDTLSLPTREFIHGQPVMVQALWRKYPDWLGSINDHARFLDPKVNPRYAPAYATNNVKDFTEAVAQAGYATDPNYAAKIVQLINQHNLETYDV